MTNQPPVLRLNNLYSKAEALAKVAGTIDRTHHDYFVRHFLAGEHGSVQAMLSHFFSKLHHHMTVELQLPKVWNIDNKNPERLAKILSNLNFNDASIVVDSKVFALEEQIKSLQHELNSLRPQRQRRADPRATKSKKQPVPSNGKRSGARSRSSKMPHACGPTESPEGSSNGEAKDKESSDAR